MPVIALLGGFFLLGVFIFDPFWDKFAAMLVGMIVAPIYYNGFGKPVMINPPPICHRGNVTAFFADLLGRI